MDPTNKQKSKLINILRGVKIESGIEDTTYRKMYPIEASSPTLYMLLKIHKKNNPEAHCVKQRLCDIWNSQRSDQNSKSPDW